MSNVIRVTQGGEGKKEDEPEEIPMVDPMALQQAISDIYARLNTATLLAESAAINASRAAKDMERLSVTSKVYNEMATALIMVCIRKINMTREEFVEQYAKLSEQELDDYLLDILFGDDANEQTDAIV
jgi:hypothetical protein